MNSIKCYFCQEYVSFHFRLFSKVPLARSAVNICRPCFAREAPLINVEKKVESPRSCFDCGVSLFTTDIRYSNSENFRGHLMCLNNNEAIPHSKIASFCDRCWQYNFNLDLTKFI